MTPTYYTQAAPFPMAPVIQMDTRERPDKTQHITYGLQAMGIKVLRSKLPYGDYMSLDRPRLVIDRKHSLLELCNNVAQDHNRFAAELSGAREYGIQMIVLIEHGYGVKTLQDVMRWKNPRLMDHPLALSGEHLYKILSTLQNYYGVIFLFCSPAETAQAIASILLQ